jgi:hypothetical protein
LSANLYHFFVKQFIEVWVHGSLQSGLFFHLLVNDLYQHFSIASKAKSSSSLCNVQGKCDKNARGMEFDINAPVHKFFVQSANLAYAISNAVFPGKLGLVWRFLTSSIN